AVRDLVLGVEVAEAVQVERHQLAPDTRSPPSTRISAPFSHAASSVASRQIRFATSSGVVSRRNGLRSRACARSDRWPGRARSAGVSGTPGWITLVRTPYGASSTASERPSASRLAFAADTAA